MPAYRSHFSRPPNQNWPARRCPPTTSRLPKLRKLSLSSGGFDRLLSSRRRATFISWLACYSLGRWIGLRMLISAEVDGLAENRTDTALCPALPFGPVRLVYREYSSFLPIYCAVREGRGKRGADSHDDIAHRWVLSFCSDGCMDAGRMDTVSIPST
jgi:hypothetical protein